MSKLNPFKMTKEERVVFFTKLSVPANVLLAAGKALLALFTLSFFLFVNALYSLGIGLAKFLSLKTHLDARGSAAKEEIGRKNRFYGLTGVVIAASGFAYALYCVRLFLFRGEETRYGTIAGITIAAVTFTELGLASVGAKYMRRRHEPMLEAIKMTNLASALVSVALTQTALLSLSGENMSVYNGLGGVVFGFLAACVGLFMLLRVKRIEKGKYAALTLKRLRRAIDRRGLSKKIQLLGCGEPRSLPLSIGAAFSPDVQKEVEKLNEKFGVRIFRETRERGAALP